MIAEAGHFALILALCIAAVQTVMPLVGAHRREASWMAVAGPAAIGQFVFLALSFGALTYSFVVSDFSVITVAANSHTAKPMLYKISGVWGNHEGSMLMWVLILALYGGAVALFGNNLPPTLKARVCGSYPSARRSPCSLAATVSSSHLSTPTVAAHPYFVQQESAASSCRSRTVRTMSFRRCV